MAPAGLQHALYIAVRNLRSKLRLLLPATCVVDGSLHHGIQYAVGRRHAAWPAALAPVDLPPSPSPPPFPAGISAEVFLCRRIAEETGGSYGVALHEAHAERLLLGLAPPPPTSAAFAGSDLVHSAG